ncbi:helix-turn-helix domain-containing protein [Bradyrhizobium sp. STM 3562]|uniref:helix-turn-helix domain-containing protein n=1 Tax=Bradyrhizobium sp. STM 3562 TaxID=578924 RepID=UPI00388FB8AF
MKLRRVVPQNLRRLRRKSGLSQEELADRRAGLNRNYIGMIEREEDSPTVDALEQISEALAVSSRSEIKMRRGLVPSWTFPT